MKLNERKKQTSEILLDGVFSLTSVRRSNFWGTLIFNPSTGILVKLIFNKKTGEIKIFSKEKF